MSSAFKPSHLFPPLQPRACQCVLLSRIKITGKVKNKLTEVWGKCSERSLHLFVAFSIFFPSLPLSLRRSIKVLNKNKRTFQNIIGCDHIPFSGICLSKDVSDESLPSPVKVNSPSEPTLGLEPYLWLSWLKKPNCCKLLFAAVLWIVRIFRS